MLIYVSRNEGTTQVRLAELSDTDPMTLVRVIDRMERDGWLERRPDPNDRRVYRLFLRPAADPVIAEITRIADKARGEALSGISADERNQLVSLLERMQQNLINVVPPSSETRRGGIAPVFPNRPARGRRGPMGHPHRRRKTSR